MNPNNPYPYEISFDQHVWLPAAKEAYEKLDGALEDRTQIAQLIKSKLTVVDGTNDHPPIIANSLLERLSDVEIDRVKTTVKQLRALDYPHSRIRIASHYFSEMREKMGTSINNPPEHIHRMQRGDFYVGDLYSADMIGNVLNGAGITFDEGQNYLDFGCSSGSLIRILKAYAVQSAFYGVDPIESSISWAQENIEGATFSVSELMPPLQFEDGQFTGATAVSIWSHLGEREGLAWFAEMHRIIKPGGWLFFTTHGPTSISYYLKQGQYTTRRIMALLEGMVNNDFVFEEVYLGKSPEGISATGYGNAFFAPSWVERNLSAGWKTLSYHPAANQSNQDIYLLQRV